MLLFRKWNSIIYYFGIGFGTLEQVDSLSIITQVALGFIAFVIGNEFPVSLD